LVLASYNAGERWVENIFNCQVKECYKDVNYLPSNEFVSQLRRLPSETQNYIGKVLSLHHQSKT
jgi:hypothetical protein